MNKKVLLATITVLILLAGCGRVGINTTEQNGQMPLAAVTTSSAIDYNQYVKKTWIESRGTNNDSFLISRIVNGKITGRFSVDAPAVPYPGDVENFNGTINKDTAECRFSDSIGNKGNIKLVFKPNDEMEATVNLTDKSQYIKERPQEGTFQFIPYNLKHIKGFSPIENQSFGVNLNSWGNVKFVSGKLTAGNHIPVVFYLTNKDGDILYDFNAALPYSVDVKAVSFEDVNKDGLKDIIIIVAGDDGLGQLATVYLQKANGSFTNDPKLDQKINDSGNNKDVKTVTSYLRDFDFQTAAVPEVKRKEYEIVKEIYSDKGVKVEYPQIVNFGNEAKQKEINELIKNKALACYLESIKTLEPNQRYEAEGRYEIKLQSDNILSIAYSSYNNIVSSAHPYNLFYTTNIDLNTGKELFLSDFVPKIDKTFVDILKKAKYVGEVDDKYEPELRDQAFGSYESDEKLIAALSNKGGLNDIYAYVTKDALGISMPVAHVAGDHAEFEIDSSDLIGLK